METVPTLRESMGSYLPLIIILILWDFIWKVVAMWKSARNKHLGWFICIAILNTLGILPIIYILLHRQKPDSNDI